MKEDNSWRMGRIVPCRSSGILVFITIMLFSTIPLSAQDSTLLKYAGTITGEELSTYVYRLASDDFEGRYTGSRGLEKAQKYIRDEFRSYGLTMPVINGHPSFNQDFVLDACRWKDQRLTLDGKEFKVGKDFLFLSDPVDIEGEFPIVFCGFGIDDPLYSDFEGTNVKGKIVLAFAGEPVDGSGNSILTGSRDLSKNAYYFSKEATASEKGAAGVFIISSDRSAFRKFIKARENENPGPVISYPGSANEMTKHKQAFSAFLSLKTAARLVNQKPAGLTSALEEIEEGRKTTAGRFAGNVSVKAGSDCITLQAGNVVGIIEGTDLKSQAVVVVAHYDHLGIGREGIFHGADDNASGTAAVMEIAEAFARAEQEGIRPARTVIFLAVSAEELGLFGSQFYTRNPVVSLDSTYACINIDMIGRASNKLSTSPDYIAATVYQSEDLLSVAKTAIGQAGQDLEDRIEYRKSARAGSDHYYFVRNNIPSIFYFQGFHPDYHEPADTPDKISYDRMEKLVRTIFATVWELANREEKLIVQN